jgi:hypothetical protein
MASIPLPALHAQVPEQPDVLSNLARLQQLKSAGNQQQLQQQAIVAGKQENQQRQMQLDDQAKLRQSFIDSEGDMDKFYTSATKAGVNPQTLIGIKANILEQKQKLATLTKDQLANYKAQTDAIGQATGSVLALPPEKRKAALLNEVIPGLAKTGVLPQEQAAPLLEQINGADDQSLEQLLKLHQFSAMATDKQIQETFNSQKRPFELQQTQAQAASAQSKAEQDERANTASKLAAAFRQGPQAYSQALGELPHKIATQFPQSPQSADEILQGGMTPHEQASVPADKLEMRDWLAKNPGKGPSDFMRYQKTIVPAFNFNLSTNGAGVAPGTPAADVAKKFGMSPEAFDQQADKYFSTGTLPPIGRGNPASQALNKAIMNRAAELHPGPLALGSAEYKANSESLKKMQIQSDAIDSFERTALKNVDLFLEQAGKVVDTGSPWVNKPLRTISEKALGNQDLPAYRAAKQIAVNEIAKITTNPGLAGVLTNEARQEVGSFNPEDATLRQTLNVVKVLKRDMENRKESNAQQISDIKGRIGGTSGGNQNNGGGAGGAMEITLPSGKKIKIQ